MNRTCIVKPSQEGRRLSAFLHHDMGISSSQIRSAKWAGRILVNGKPETVACYLRTGDLVEFVLPQAEPVYEVHPREMPLSIPYRDDYMLIIDKPAGLATSSSLNHPDDALENALFSALGCPADYVFRPVNRLDKGTSGLMCAALDPVTQHTLQSMLHTPEFEREYLAVTDGIPEKDRGVIDLPIAKAEGPTLRREIRPDGKPSVTNYEVLEARRGRALVKLKLETGRTHQIRVHLSALGTPVFGDFMYGRESEELPGRFALHSAFLTLRHPDSGEKMTFSSPLPEDLRRLLD